MNAHFFRNNFQTPFFKYYSKNQYLQNILDKLQWPAYRKYENVLLWQTFVHCAISSILITVGWGRLNSNSISVAHPAIENRNQANICNLEACFKPVLFLALNIKKSFAYEKDQPSVNLSKDADKVLIFPLCKPILVNKDG